MKKLLIVNNNLHIGGVQRALVDLLKEIHDKYDITLALFQPQGALLEEVPDDVTVLPVRSAYRYLGLGRNDVAGKPFLKLRRGFYAGLCRLFGRDTVISLMALGQRKLRGFDAAISYLHDGADKVFYGGCNDFVLRHTDAEKKITFLHCDFALSGADTKKNAARYEKFDCIAACSKGCADGFLRQLPQFLGKTIVVSNCQDYNGIWCKASKKDLALPQDRINVLTVARFGKEKGVDRGVEAFARLSALKERFHYYIIGDGICRPAVEKAIKDGGLLDHVTLLGEMDDPYGYMKAADLLLIPSVSEAAPLVIGEAASLGTPVLSTRTSSAVEMIEDTGFGWVCDNDVPALSDGLKNLLEDPALLSETKARLRRSKIDNEKAVSQFISVIG